MNDLDAFDELAASLAATATFAPERLDVEHPTKLQRGLAEERLRQRIQDALLRRLKQLKTKRPDFSANRIAERLGKNKSQVSRWLAGTENMTLRTIAELFLGLECEPEIWFTPFGEARETPCRHAAHCPDSTGRDSRGSSNTLSLNIIFRVHAHGRLPYTSAIAQDTDEAPTLQFSTMLRPQIPSPRLPVQRNLIALVPTQTPHLDQRDMVQETFAIAGEQ